MVQLLDLAQQASELWDTKGLRKLLATSAGVSVAEYPASPARDDWHRLVQAWAQVRLVNLSFVPGSRWPQVQLNVLTDDIEHAYRGDEMWDRIRSQ